MEPWDGPASIAFTDGSDDRRGPRPQRPAALPLLRHQGRPGDHGLRGGVLDIPPENVLRKGRLQPGRMFLVDTEEGRIIADEEIKRQIATEQPYRQWLDEHLVHLDDLPAAPDVPAPDHATLLQRQLAFGYTFEDQRIILTPMAQGRRRGRRLDGQRHAAGGALRASRSCSTTTSSSSSPRSPTRRSTASARRLITSAEVWLGLGRQPAGAPARRLPAPRAEEPDPDQRGVRQGPAPGAARPSSRRAVHPVPRRRAARRAWWARWRTSGARPAAMIDEREHQRPHPVRPRREQRARADPGAARRSRACTTT